jgi:hypothetical protein
MTTPLDFAPPFVTGTVALLWSEFPRASAATVRAAVTGAHGMRRTTVVPPLLDAWAAYEVLNGFEDEVRVTARIHSSTLFNRVFASPDLHS